MYVDVFNDVKVNYYEYWNWYEDELIDIMRWRRQGIRMFCMSYSSDVPLDGDKKLKKHRNYIS